MSQFIEQTSVTRFITNRLFGRGRRWNGKSFTRNEVNTPATNNIGWNRFEVFSQHRANQKPNTKKKIDPSTITVILKTEKEHCFDYDIKNSRLHPNDPSIVIEYSQYQRKLSLWKGMMDEIRLLPIGKTSTELPAANSKSTNYDIMIGLGSMNWSGGIWNCSPFCLYRKI
jgi:hypothetical protein